MLEWEYSIPIQNGEYLITHAIFKEKALISFVKMILLKKRSCRPAYNIRSSVFVHECVKHISFSM